MKYVVILADGMADEPIESLGNKTPLEVAQTPNIDKISSVSEIGSVYTIPEGMSPGSDTANLSVLGYDPKVYYTGRSPLEALSIGVPLDETTVTFRMNFVTLDEATIFSHKKILDHSSGEITTEEASALLSVIQDNFTTEEMKFYLGTSYRHLLAWQDGDKDIKLTAPHDILGKEVANFLPSHPVLLNMMEKSYDLLNDHPINIKRREKGLNPANAIWFWGAGTKPLLTPFEEKFGVKGAMISAVDLLKGIAVGADMEVVNVPGANGTLHTNYKGKAEAALKALKERSDFVYVHIEAPDECGHQGNLEHKIKAIEYIDEMVVGPILEGLEDSGEPFKLMILPDHPTPIKYRTHTEDPVPYLIYEKGKVYHYESLYNEKASLNTGIVIKEGHQLMARFLGESL